VKKRRGKNSARGGTRAIEWFGPQRGQEARQQAKRAQGWAGEKPQEDYSRQAQRAEASARTAQERVNAAICSIHARFGKCAIGLSYLGMRYVRV
jgi:hypothetical protein